MKNKAWGSQSWPTPLTLRRRADPLVRGRRLVGLVVGGKKLIPLIGSGSRGIRADQGVSPTNRWELRKVSGIGPSCRQPVFGRASARDARSKGPGTAQVARLKINNLRELSLESGSWKPACGAARGTEVLLQPNRFREYLILRETSFFPILRAIRPLEHRFYV